MIVSAVDAQTLVDAVGLGAVYALMAVGIGLVFGVLRLVNFAYGQLIMAGAYTLAFTSGWPVAGSVLACFAVVIALSFLMDGVVFRPLRTQSPAVMLVTTFAVAFLLQAVALILDVRDGTIGEPAVSVASLNQVVTVGGVDIRKVTILAVAVAIVALGLLALLLGRTTIGLQMRAASTDFRTARLLGVKADRVIGAAVLLSGILAATVAVILTVQNPLVSPDFALKETIVVLVGVVVGGIDRLWTATLGGFSIGFATGVINGALPTDKTVFLPSVVFALVILVLLLRPAGLFAGGQHDPRRPRMRRLDAWITFLGPAALVVLVGVGANFVSRSNEIHFLNALVAVSVVVAIYVFVGSSGVLSFGQISFVAVGAFAAGVLTVPLESKTGVLPDLFPILRDHTIGNVASLLLAAARRRAVRLPRRPAADAPVRACRRDRHVRRARDHAQPLARMDQDRPGRDDLVARAGDDRAASGHGRRGDRDRRRLGVSAEPARAARRGRRARIPPPPRQWGSACTGSGCGRSRSRARCVVSPAACSCTCSARSRPSRSTSS